MAKNNRKARGAARSSAKKSKPPATPKKTAAEMSDQQSQRLLQNHKRKIKPLLDAEKAAKAAVAKAKELAKKEGVPWKDLKLALALDTEEGAEACRTEMERLLRLDRWMGTEIGEQLELFAKQSAAEKAYEAGRRAALDNEPRRPPLHLSDAASKHWMKGHEDGTAQVNKARDAALNGFVPLGDAAAEVAGTEPPTYEEENREAA